MKPVTCRKAADRAELAVPAPRRSDFNFILQIEFGRTLPSVVIDSHALPVGQPSTGTPAEVVGARTAPVPSDESAHRVPLALVSVALAH
jgi:hypothetical protein